jgi:ABC-type phosphate transport system permease subunit
MTSQLAAHVSTKLAAILWSAPITLLPTLLFLWSEDVPAKKVSTFAWQTVIALINLMLFSISLAALMRMDYFIKDENGIIKATGIALLVWGFGSLVLYNMKE